MYSEHLAATLLNLVETSYYSGADLDADLGRISVEVGKILGPDLGCRPSDAALAWYVGLFGVPAPFGSRASFHITRDRRVGFGLGPGRGIIETAGDRLALITNPSPSRYTGAWRLPHVEHGGLI